MEKCSYVPVKVIKILKLANYSSIVTDNNLYLYNTEGTQFKCFKTIAARDVGWSVSSVDFRYDPLILVI